MSLVVTAPDAFAKSIDTSPPIPDKSRQVIKDGLVLVQRNEQFPFNGVSYWVVVIFAPVSACRVNFLLGELGVVPEEFSHSVEIRAA